MPTRLGGGGVDFDRLKRDFVSGRDLAPPNRDASRRGKAKGACKHCQLSSRCYDQVSANNNTYNISAFEKKRLTGI